MSEPVSGGKEPGAGRRVVYCLIPYELGEKLHEPLRRHFAELDPEVEVVVEHRDRTRRSDGDRREREGPSPTGTERRTVRNPDGRRAGERRAALEPLTEPPELPRRVRRHAEAIRFVERIEPDTEAAEDLDTARVVIAFQAGDREAFTTLYTRYFDRVFGYLKMAFRDVHEAEDATQQVFVRVLESLDAYERRRQPFRAWLFTIARRHAIAEMRRLGRIEPMDPAELDRVREANGESSEDKPRTGAFDWIADGDLMLFVERLPPSQQQVIVLRFLFDMTDRQIASALDRTPVDVRTLQHRALKYLRARLKAIGREPASVNDGGGETEAERDAWRRRVVQAPVLRSRRWALDP